MLIPFPLSHSHFLPPLRSFANNNKRAVVRKDAPIKDKVGILIGGGSGHEYYSGYPGGGSFFGGAGATGYPRGGHYAYNHQYRAAQGSGGSPGYHTSRRGARGMQGIICVWNFR